MSSIKSDKFFNRHVRSFFAAVTVTVICLTLGSYAIFETYQLEKVRAKEQFDLKATSFSRAIHDQLEDNVLNTFRLTALMSDFSDLTKEKYENFIAAGQVNNLEKGMIFDVKRVYGRDLKDHQKWYEETYDKKLIPFGIKEGQFVRLNKAANEPYYLTQEGLIFNLNPKRYIGLDLSSLGHISSFIDQLEVKNQPIVFPMKTRFANIQLENLGLVILSPYMNKKFQKGEEFSFLARLSFIDEILSNLNNVSQYNGMLVSIDTNMFKFDDGKIEFMTDGLRSIKPSTNFETPFDPFDVYTYQVELPFFDRQLSIAITASQDMFPINTHSILITAISAGIMLVIILGIFFALLMRAINVEKLAESRMLALKDINDDLESKSLALQNVNEELSDAKTQAEDANRAKSEFLATMSHELRTLLNSVIGFSQLLETQSLGPIGEDKYVEYAKSIHDSGAHLLEMINDILDLAKLESGKVDLSASTFDVTNFFTSVVTSFAPQVEEKKLELKVEIDKEMPTALYADRLRLKQILINLIGNAIKFTSEGSVKIGVYYHAARAGDPKWSVEVIDTGIGIPKNKLSTLFERFHQADRGIAREYGGTGLGLAICRELCQLMNGSIEVTSTEGIGSVFRVTLPMIEADILEDDDLDGDFI